MVRPIFWNLELLSPAGDFETALAAFAAGADAVYCGLSEFSARAFAKNLSIDELKDLVAYAHSQHPPRRDARRLLRDARFCVIVTNLI